MLSSEALTCNFRLIETRISTVSIHWVLLQCFCLIGNISGLQISKFGPGHFSEGKHVTAICAPVVETQCSDTKTKPKSIKAEVR